MRAKFIIVYLILTVELLIAAFLLNRAFITGFSVALCIYFINTSKQTKRQKYLVVVAIVSSLLFSLIFFVKSDSSYGRWLIYRVSWNIFIEHWKTGIGLGRFQTTYLVYQARFFSEGRYNTKDLLVADNTYYAFNEYFQLMVEIGVAGFGLVILVIWCFFEAIRIVSKAKQNIFLLWLVLCQLIAIAVASMFTYVMHLLLVQLTVLILVTVFILLAFSSKNRVIMLSTLAGCVLCASLIVGQQYFFSLKYYQYSQKLNETKSLYRAGFKQEAMEDALNYPAIMYNNPDYLELLSSMQVSAVNLADAERTTKQLLKKHISFEGYIRLAAIYQLEEKYDVAEKSLLMAINMVPNRFRSRYLLYKLLVKRGKMKDASNCRNEILHLPIKIPSEEIDRILTELKK